MSSSSRQQRRGGVFRGRGGRDGGGGRGGGRFGVEGNPTEVVGKEKVEKKSPLKSLAESSSSQDHIFTMEMLENERLVVFVDFSGVSGEQISGIAITASSKTLLHIRTQSFHIDPKDVDTELYDIVYSMIHKKVLIGHDILTSWEKFCCQIGIAKLQCPEPKKIIDTALFIESKTKLAKLADLFGLGKPIVSILRLGWSRSASSRSYDKCLSIITALKKCRDAMPILGMADKNQKIHPMIYHLMKSNDERSAMEAEKSPFKSSVVGSSGEDDFIKNLEKETYFVLFDFKEDQFGMLRFAASTLCPKTLKTTFCEIGFSIRPYSKTQDEYEGEEDTLEEFYSEVYDILHEKVWIGHGIHKSDFPRLINEYVDICKTPPFPKYIIDTAPFIKSGTKLAKLAVLFDLGKPTVGNYFKRHEYLFAIQKCADTMSILDMEMEMDLGIHRMICHLIKFQPPEKDFLAAKQRLQKMSMKRLSRRESPRLKEARKDNKKSKTEGGKEG